MATYVDEHDANEYYHIFLQQSDSKIPVDMQKIFEYCWRHQLIHCNIQVQTAKGEIFIYGYYPNLDADNCGKPQPFIVNEFVGSEWKNSIFFPKILNNFRGCPLQVAVRQVVPFLSLSLNKEGDLEANGFESALLRQMADFMNLTFDFIDGLPDERSGATCCGPLAQVRLTISK